MARRIWIIAKKDKVEDSDIADAKLANCPEIVNGIPPALTGIITESSLPMAYEEVEPKPSEPVRDLAKEIDQLKAEVASLKAKVSLV